MGGLSEHVFGYGSLVADLAAEGRPARLVGYRRTWGVAADNAHAIPGYKRYLSPDGTAPDVFVAFLDVVEDPGAAVSGLLAPVSADELNALDRRERNYERLDVTAALDAPIDGRAWTYVGSPEGRARLAEGLERGTAVIQREYLERARRALLALGDGHDSGFAAADLAALPVLDLERADLPPAEPGA